MEISPHAIRIHGNKTDKTANLDPTKDMNLLAKD